MFGTKKLPATPEERAAAAKIRDAELETFCRYPDAETDAKTRRREVQSVPDLWNLTLTYLSEGEKRNERKTRRESTVRSRKVKSPKKDDAPPKARLSQKEEDDLRFYFEVFPSICGLRSNWQATVEAMDECAKCGAAHELPVRRKLCGKEGCRHEIGKFHYNSYMRVKAEGSSAWHPNVDANMLGLVTSGEVERANKIRDALIAMVDAGYSKDVTVLYRVYGEQNRCAMFLQFGILAQIVEYTRVVEKYAAEKGVTPRAYLENRLSGGKDSVFKAAVTMSAEALLRQAESRYVQCK